MGKWRKGDSSPPRGDDDGDIGSATPSGGRAAPSGWQPGVPTTGQTRSKSHTLLAPKPSTPRNSRRLRVTKPSPLGPPPAWSYLGPEAMVHPRRRNAVLPLKRLGLLLKPALGVRGSTPGPRGSGPEAEQVLRRHWRSVNTPGCRRPRPAASAPSLGPLSPPPRAPVTPAATLAHSALSSSLSHTHSHTRTIAHSVKREATSTDL